ncbi:MAG: thiamine pyrophosphate-dependent enzyme [Acidobacteriota bacterium]
MTTQQPSTATEIDTPGDLISRFAAFVADRFPYALELTGEAFEAALGESDPASWEQVDEIERLRSRLRHELARRTTDAGLPETLETTPGIIASRRLDIATEALVEACDGFLHREAIVASLTNDERREMLGGMILTRATDNRLKAFFLGSEVRYGDAAFQGKGFRSLGQEAIYGSCLRLRRSEDEYRDDDGTWNGDVIAPLIRDIGAALGMHPQPETVRMILNAQMAKSGPPMNGKDLHIGDMSRGILPPAAPLSISALNISGIAFAMAREGKGRVAVTYIGEGGTSLGEWHEAINVCAARKLPAIFCVENNQTALSTPLHEQTAARTFADKAAGYGIPGLTLDGTDVEAVAAAFAWAAERARQGHGPTLIELVTLRMCGHAHHDDMLYLGYEPKAAWDYPAVHDRGYADREAYEAWSRRDPLKRYAARLEATGVIGPGDFETWKREAEQLVEGEAQSIIAAPWPDPSEAGQGVYGDLPPARHLDLASSPAESDPAEEATGPGEVEPGRPFDADGQTFLEAITLGLGDALERDERTFVFGEDVGGRYGNAFLLLRPLLGPYGSRILNSPLTEGGTLGVCVGAALAGLRPIGEIQFNDFIATGFNQLVNNAAKIRYRWGAGVPMVVRMPWGGLRYAGPYHSQNTEAWFYRTPGLKVVAPSTPEDARALLAAAVADPDPVLFYEHIKLYRDPSIKQKLGDAAPEPLPLGRAALRRAGSDLAIVSYGAYVHLASRVADRLAEDGIECSVLDLRSLVPLDRSALLRVARHCGKVLILHEDTRTGSIGESLAAIIQEQAFAYLDAPVRILGALDTPVPYSPPLEAAFLVSEEQAERAARWLIDY